MPASAIHIKPELRFSLHPFKWLNVGVTGSMLQLNYKNGTKELHMASPLWMYGAFVDAELAVSPRLCLFGGVSYLGYSVQYGKGLGNSATSDKFMYNPPKWGQNRSANLISPEIGVKVRVVHSLYAYTSVQYGSLYLTDYYCGNIGVAFRF